METKPHEDKRSDAYWAGVMNALAQDGPAPVPDDLAARAAARALEHSPAPSLLDALYDLAKPAVGFAWATAAVVLLFSSVRGEGTASSSEAIVDVIDSDGAFGDDDSFDREVLGLEEEA